MKANILPPIVFLAGVALFVSFITLIQSCSPENKNVWEVATIKEMQESDGEYHITLRFQNRIVIGRLVHEKWGVDSNEDYPTCKLIFNFLKVGDTVEVKTVSNSGKNFFSSSFGIIYTHNICKVGEIEVSKRWENLNDSVDKTLEMAEAIKKNMEKVAPTEKEQ